MSFVKIDSKIIVLCVIYFMLAQSSMTSRATADALLLKYFDEESIPLMIMSAASLSIMLALLTTYLCGRFQAYGAVKITIGGLIVAMAGVVSTFSLVGGKLVATGAYMICEVVVVMPMVLYWGMAMGVLNPKESKRWFGLIGAAGTCGCILAGYTVSWASRSGNVNEITLGIVTVLLLVVMLILLSRASMFTIKEDKPDSATDMQAAGIFRRIALLISSRQSILMTWLVVFSATVMCLIDINFKFDVRQKYAGELHNFFGLFYSYTSIAQLILQLFIVRTILMKGGVFAAITILPALLLLTAVCALILNRADAVYAGKFITQVFFFTIEYVGLQMLFLAVRKQVRGQMNSAIDGLTRPSTIALISLLVTYTLFFWQENIVLRLNMVVIVLCCLWLFVAWLNYRQYLTSLSGMLNSRVLDFDREINVLTDSKFDSQLRESLSGANKGDALFIAELVLGMERPDWVPEFREILGKDDQRLKACAIRYLSEFGDKDDRVKLLEDTKTSPAELRIEVIRNLWVHRDKEEVDLLLEALLDDDDAMIRCATSSFLLSSKDEGLKNRALTLFNYCLDSDNEEVRLLAVRCLAWTHFENSEEVVERLLKDEDYQVSRAAILAVNEERLPVVFDQLADSLVNESLNPLVSDRLREIGKPAQDLIRSRLASLSYESDPSKFRALLISLIEFSKGVRSPDIEKFIAQVAEGTWRTIVSLTYYSSLTGARSTRRFRSFVLSEMDKHMSQAEFFHTHLGRLQDGDSNAALRMALEYQCKLRLKVVTTLLSLIDPSIDYGKLLEIVGSGEENSESEATEVVKGVVGVVWADRIVGMVGKIDKPTGIEVSAKRMIGAFRDSDSRWILAGLLLTFSEDDYEDCRSFVKGCLNHEDGMVRETALSVFLSHENQKQEIREQCEISKNDPHAPVSFLANRELALA